MIIMTIIKTITATITIIIETITVTAIMATIPVIIIMVKINRISWSWNCISKTIYLLSCQYFMINILHVHLGHLERMFSGDVANKPLLLSSALVVHWSIIVNWPSSVPS